jgi:hypothetical protein
MASIVLIYINMPFLLHSSSYIKAKPLSLEIL